MQTTIVIGVSIIVIVIIISYNLDQAKISGQRFGDELAQIQSDLNDETKNYDSNMSQYQTGKITRDAILQISDKHLDILNNILSRYSLLRPPEAFAPSLELFKLSTESQIDSDKLLKEWIQTGENSTRVKSDQLLRHAFEYEARALNSFNTAKGNSG